MTKEKTLIARESNASGIKFSDDFDIVDAGALSPRGGLLLACFLAEQHRSRPIVEFDRNTSASWPISQRSFIRSLDPRHIAQ